MSLHSLPTIFAEFEDCYPPCSVALGHRLRGYTRSTSIALVATPLASLTIDEKGTISSTAEFLRILQRVKEGEHQPENRFHGMWIREILLSESFTHTTRFVIHWYTVENSYNKPETSGQTVCYKQEFVISEQFPMRYCSTWLRSLLCYIKKFVTEEFVIRVLHCTCAE